MPAKAPRIQANAQSQLFLRIKHPTLDPTEISAMLGLQAEHAVKAGDDVSATGVRRLFNETYWLAALPDWSRQLLAEALAGKPAEFRLSSAAADKEDVRALMRSTNIQDFSIICWLRKFEAQREFFAHINQTQGSVTLLLNRGNREAAFTISPPLAQRLAKLGVALEID